MVLREVKQCPTVHLTAHINDSCKRVCVCVCVMSAYMYGTHTCACKMPFKKPCMQPLSVLPKSAWSELCVRLCTAGDVGLVSGGWGRVLSRDKHENKANFSFAQTCTQASVCFVNHTIAHLKLQTSEPNSYVHGSNPVCKPGLVNSVYQKIKILMMVPSDLSPAVLCKCLHLQCNLSVITGESRNSSEGGSLKGI